MLENILYDAKIGPSSGGRKPVLITTNPSYGKMLSVEISPKSITGKVYDFNCEPLTPQLRVQIKDNKDSLEILYDFIDKLLQTSPKDLQVIGCSLSVRGTVSKNGSIKYMANEYFRNINLHEKLTQKFNIKFIINNAANVEAYYNSVHLNNDDVAILTLQTGVGLGIVEATNIQLGNNGYYGEIGHSIVKYNGRQCPCGNKGCLEQYIATSTLIKEASKAFGKDITSDELLQLFISNHEVIAEMKNEYFEYLSVSINNIINIINPKYVVLSSKFLSKLPGSLERINNMLESKVSDYYKILFTLSEEGSLVGGCYLLIKEHFNLDKYELNLNKK